MTFVAKIYTTLQCKNCNLEEYLLFYVKYNELARWATLHLNFFIPKVPSIRKKLGGGEIINKSEFFPP